MNEIRNPLAEYEKLLAKKALEKRSNQSGVLVVTFIIASFVFSMTGVRMHGDIFFICAAMFLCTAGIISAIRLGRSDDV